MTNPMPKRQTGSPPALALGTMNFGKRTPAVDSERIVRRALERGITIFDTANAYNAGESERILGQALGRDRDRVVVATKVGFGRTGGKPEGLSPEVMQRELPASLDRLGMAYVDVYYLHVPDHQTPIERSLDVMKSFVDSGKVKSWGVSNYAAWQILEMNGYAAAQGLMPPVVSQVIYNLVHRQLDIEYFAFTRKHAIHTTVFNPLAGGLLAGTQAFEASPSKGSRFDGNALYQRRYWTRAMFERVEELRAVGRAEGLTMVELAVAWVASRPAVDSILLGPATVAQLDEAIDAVAKTLSEGSIKRIDELARTWAGTDTSYVR